MMDREAPIPTQSSPLLSVLLGVLFSIGATFPAAILTACFYRFPVIMSGDVSIPEFIGTKGLGESLRLLPGIMLGISLTVFILGIRGWYVILALVGGIGGWLIHRSGTTNYRGVVRKNLFIAIVLGFVFALVSASMGTR
ncbi:hypothetical protein [Schlesneria paludicola]|uniref:hypothetical protein n=1 Tax=Schlesneria paludicola TaxID=360056 RepID=UPI00029A8DB5|nr:hypothetical protein [Schlesneria paludicola]